VPAPSSRLWAVLLSAAAALAAAAAGAEPQITLRLPAFPGSRFPNFSSVVVPAVEHGPLELWVEDGLDEVKTATVRVRLNDLPMTPFVSINPLPRKFHGRQSPPLTEIFQQDRRRRIQLHRFTVRLPHEDSWWRAKALHDYRSFLGHAH